MKLNKIIIVLSLFSSLAIADATVNVSKSKPEVAIEAAKAQAAALQETSKKISDELTTATPAQTGATTSAATMVTAEPPIPDDILEIIDDPINNEKVLKWIQLKPENKNAVNIITIDNEIISKSPLLHQILSQDNYSLAKELILKYEPDLNQKNTEDDTPLDIVLRRFGQIKTVQDLLSEKTRKDKYITQEEINNLIRYYPKYLEDLEQLLQIFKKQNATHRGRKFIILAIDLQENQLKALEAGKLAKNIFYNNLGLGVPTADQKARTKEYFQQHIFYLKKIKDLFEKYGFYEKNRE